MRKFQGAGEGGSGAVRSDLREVLEADFAFPALSSVLILVLTGSLTRRAQVPATAPYSTTPKASCTVSTAPLITIFLLKVNVFIEV